MTYRLLWLIVTMLLASNAVAQLATQKDSAHGVTVAVTPADLAAGAKTWDFSIVFDTHSQDLSDDIVQSAVLMDDRRNEFRALSWDGAGPGGHHRSGVLKFKPVEPQPQALELRINRPGEGKPRTFRWRLP